MTAGARCESHPITRDRVDRRRRGMRWVFVDGRVFEPEARPRERARARCAHGSLTAPMPATVLRVLVKVGDAVKRGDRSSSSKR